MGNGCVNGKDDGDDDKRHGRSRPTKDGSDAAEAMEWRRGRGPTIMTTAHDGDGGNPGDGKQQQQEQTFVCVFHLKEKKRERARARVAWFCEDAKR